MIIKCIVMSGVIGAAVAIGYHWRLSKLIKAINAACQAALSERQMANLFTTDAKGQATSLDNLNMMFTMFKSLDQLKTARVFLEVKSLKQLSTAISDGIILVRSDRVVTYINTVAETQLKLPTGDSVGESMIWHMPYDNIRTAFDNAIISGEKATDIPIKTAYDKHLLISLLPVHDKFGVVSRVILVIKSSTIV